MEDPDTNKQQTDPQGKWEKKPVPKEPSSAPGQSAGAQGPQVKADRNRNQNKNPQPNDARESMGEAAGMDDEDFKTPASESKGEENYGKGKSGDTKQGAL